MNNNNNKQQKQQKQRQNPPKQKQPKQRAARKQRKAKRQAEVAAAYATGQSGQAPMIQQSRDSCRVVHREFIANVTGTTAFAIAAGNTFAVNPGLAASFPWLSGIAQNWEAYRFRKLRLCYYTRTGSNVPGSVIMAHDPDASDAAPVSEQIMTTYKAVEEDAPWKDICLDVPQVNLHEMNVRKFVRSTALSANQDIKLYDAGSFFVGTVDGTAVSWGKLWVKYDIDLYTPQLPPAGIAGGNGMLVPGGAPIAAATPFGSTPVSSGQFALAATATNVVSFSGLTIGAAYDIRCYVVGTVITAVSTGTAVGGTLSLQRNSSLNAAATNGMCSALFTATATSGSFVLTVTATTVTGGALSLFPQPAASSEA